MSHPPIHWPETRLWVTEAEIQRAFNQGKFSQRAKSGALKVTIFRESHANPIKTREPFCTLSQMLVYWTQDGNPVALVHQYLRPDGKVGASGKPDPKVLVVNDQVLAFRARRTKH